MKVKRRILKAIKKNKSLSKKIETNEIYLKNKEEDTTEKSVVLKSQTNFEKKEDNKVKTLKFTDKIPVNEDCLTAIACLCRR